MVFLLSYRFKHWLNMSLCALHWIANSRRLCEFTTKDKKPSQSSFHDSAIGSPLLELLFLPQNACTSSFQCPDPQFFLSPNGNIIEFKVPLPSSMPQSGSLFSSFVLPFHFLTMFICFSVLCINIICDYIFICAYIYIFSV